MNSKGSFPFIQVVLALLCVFEIRSGDLFGSISTPDRVRFALLRGFHNSASEAALSPLITTSNKLLKSSGGFLFAFHFEFLVYSGGHADNFLKGDDETCRAVVAQ